ADYLTVTIDRKLQLDDTFLFPPFGNLGIFLETVKPTLNTGNIVLCLAWCAPGMLLVGVAGCFC
ncbi:hypothetical protein Q4595_26450, partial [Wenyingzhuangia sp. 1_MG-2023]|nr:hypothetical protein [Wenyingzhuangia sp. 1_MG-2023]